MLQATETDSWVNAFTHEDIAQSFTWVKRWREQIWTLRLVYSITSVLISHSSELFSWSSLRLTLQLVVHALIDALNISLIACHLASRLASWLSDLIDTRFNWLIDSLVVSLTDALIILMVSLIFPSIDSSLNSLTGWTLQFPLQLLHALFASSSWSS